MIRTTARGGTHNYVGGRVLRYALVCEVCEDVELCNVARVWPTISFAGGPSIGTCALSCSYAKLRNQMTSRCAGAVNLVPRAVPFPLFVSSNEIPNTPSARRM